MPKNPNYLDRESPVRNSDEIRFPKNRLIGTASLVMLFCVIVTSSTSLSVQASSNEGDNEDNPVSGALRDLAKGIDESDAGTEAGRNAAREDFYAGTNERESCPREAGAWCFGYNTGYSTVMSQLESAHR